nr:hypothetical protein CFP56_29444 [Quercus suber]
MEISEEKLENLHLLSKEEQADLCCQLDDTITYYEHLEEAHDRLLKRLYPDFLRVYSLEVLPFYLEAEERGERSRKDPGFPAMGLREEEQEKPSGFWPWVLGKKNKKKYGDFRGVAHCGSLEISGCGNALGFGDFACF